MTHRSIHAALAHSYLAYFICSIVGLFADTMIGFTIPQGVAATITAIGCFALGAGIIGWAQYTSRHTGEHKDPYFLRGPYRYLRNPTHLGLVLLVSGYTAVSGSLIFLGVTVIGYIISNVFFKEYETLLVDEYDGAYEHYKTKTPKIF